MNPNALGELGNKLPVACGLPYPPKSGIKVVRKQFFQAGTRSQQSAVMPTVPACRPTPSPVLPQHFTPPPLSETGAIVFSF